MRAVFADVGYWIATVDEDDALHLKAVALARSVAALEIVTTEMVLTELLNHVADFGPTYRRKAVGLVRSLRQSQAVRVLPFTEALFEAALLRYERFRDKQWGLTDCASFVIMESLGLTDALAYDHHFQQAGFRARLREPSAP